jgi:hypothetical protein
MGVQKFLIIDGTQYPQQSDPRTLTAFNSDGFSLGTDIGYGFNTNAATFVDWVFRNAPNFYHHEVVTKSSGSNASFDFSMHSAGLGMVRVRRTDVAGSWYVWHRSLTAGKLLIGETTAAETTLGHITVSGTTVTLVDGVIADGTYLVEAFAHDTSADGIIQCGSFTTDVNDIATVNLGWESQYVWMKSASTTSNWFVFDSMRGWSLSNDEILAANTSDAANTLYDFGQPTATGFYVDTPFSGNQTYIYLAIRRPNKPPTSGTEVYNAIAVTPTSNQLLNFGFPVDLSINTLRTGTVVNWMDRLRGGNTATAGGGTYRRLFSTDPDAENSGTGSGLGFDNSVGLVENWYTGSSTIYWSFRRAPGVFDNFCDTGSGANKTESHNLAAIPELWLRKGRSGATEWVWGSSLLANTQKIVMPSPNGVVTDATAWNSTYPTATQFSVGTAAAVNTSSATYTTYLWATLPGISKVFTYTGDGGSGKVINCGFSAGARFIMIIRTTASTAQDIFIWDSVRGIIAGNDPHLSLNTTAAEVTTDDSVDPDNSGFAVNQVAATNINVTGAVYIGVAYA